MSTFLKYLLVHLPEWALVVLVASLVVSLQWLSWPAAFVLVSLWIGIHLAVYPLLRSAFEGKAPMGAETLIGMTAVAREPLNPSGFVSLRGELWRARLPENEPFVPAGATVRVAAAEGLTLIVRS